VGLPDQKDVITVLMVSRTFQMVDVNYVLKEE
jgi:hypothetical protein